MGRSKESPAATLDRLAKVLFATNCRAGLISKGFETRLMLSAIALAIASFGAWRSRQRTLGK